MNGSRRFHWIAAGLLVAALVAGCSLYRNDRAWLSDTQYDKVRKMYIQTGSLDLVQRQLQDWQWRRSEINEAVYRLGKEFQVLPEELPSTPLQNSETTTSTATLK